MMEAEARVAATEARPPVAVHVRPTPSWSVAQRPAEAWNRMQRPREATMQ